MNPLAVRDAVAGEFVTAFAAAGVDADVIPTPRADAPTVRPRVVLAVRAVRNADVACPVRRCSLDVWAVVPNQDTSGPADDALDEFLAAVLDAVDGMPRTSWETADRGVFLDDFPAYRVTIERQAG